MMSQVVPYAGISKVCQPFFSLQPSILFHINCASDTDSLPQEYTILLLFLISQPQLILSDSTVAHVTCSSSFEGRDILPLPSNTLICITCTLATQLSSGIPAPIIAKEAAYFTCCTTLVECSAGRATSSPTHLMSFLR
jgi:hypothetical protein